MGWRWLKVWLLTCVVACRHISDPTASTNSQRCFDGVTKRFRRPFQSPRTGGGRRSTIRFRVRWLAK